MSSPRPPRGPKYARTAESEREFERTAFIPESVFKTLKRHGAQASHRATIDILYLHADRTGMCYPGEETIAKEAGCTVRTVRRAIRDLERWGLVEVARGGGVASNTYFLLHVFRPRTPDTGDRGVTPVTTTPDTPVLQPRIPVSATPVTRIPQPRTPVSAKQSLQQSSNTPPNSSPGPRAAEERGPGDARGMRSIGDVMKAVSPELAAAVPGKWRDLPKE